MDNSKNKLLAVPLLGAVFFLVLFFLVSLATGYKPYSEAASVFSVLRTVFGWLGLFAFASFVIVMFGRMSQLITSGWFIGILGGAVVAVGGSAIFLFSAAGPRTTTVDGKSIRSVKQLTAFLEGGTAAIDAAENPNAQQGDAAAPKVTGEAAQYAGLFEKKCNSCHPFKSVASKFTTKYVAQGKIADAVEMMRSMPNSGITKQDAEHIVTYLTAAYSKKAEAPAATGAAAPAAAPAPEAAKIFFAAGKADLPKDADKLLAALVDYMKANAGAKLDISGFHDATGDAAKNAELAKQRAVAVKDLLVKAGVAEAQINMKKPEVTTGGTDPKEARRVEVSAVAPAAEVAAAPAAGGPNAAAALSPEELKEAETLFNKKCNSCHPFKSVLSNFTTKYASKGKVGDAVEMMRKMPNSGITQKDAEKITAYLTATYVK